MSRPSWMLRRLACCLIHQGITKLRSDIGHHIRTSVIPWHLSKSETAGTPRLPISRETPPAQLSPPACQPCLLPHLACNITSLIPSIPLSAIHSNTPIGARDAVSMRPHAPRSHERGCLCNIVPCHEKAWGHGVHLLINEACRILIKRTAIPLQMMFRLHHQFRLSCWDLLKYLRTVVFIVKLIDTCLV